MIFAWGLSPNSTLLEKIFALPMAATPILFFMGICLGFIGAEIYLSLLIFRNNFKVKND
jgi:hypothetical protein